MHYYKEERPQSRNSPQLQQRWVDPVDEYSNHSLSDMAAKQPMDNFGQYQSPIADFNQPPPNFVQFSNAEVSPDSLALKHNDPRYDQIMRNLPVITPNTKILPTVDLTRPPPPAAPISVMPYIMPGVPHPNNAVPSLGGPLPGFNPAVPPPIQPVVDQAEVVKRAKMELYNRDLQKIISRGQLVEYRK